MCTASGLVTRSLHPCVLCTPNFHAISLYQPHFHLKWHVVRVQGHKRGKNSWQLCDSELDILLVKHGTRRINGEFGMASPPLKSYHQFYALIIPYWWLGRQSSLGFPTPMTSPLTKNIGTVDREPILVDSFRWPGLSGDATYGALHCRVPTSPSLKSVLSIPCLSSHTF